MLLPHSEAAAPVLKQAVSVPQHNKPDADNDIDDDAPRNVPLRNGNKALIGAMMMGIIAQTVSEKCGGNEPGVDPDAQQGCNHKQESDAELDLLLEIVAANDSKAEIDARHHAHHDRGQ